MSYSVMRQKTGISRSASNHASQHIHHEWVESLHAIAPSTLLLVILVQGSYIAGFDSYLLA